MADWSGDWGASGGGAWDPSWDASGGDWGAGGGAAGGYTANASYCTMEEGGVEFDNPQKKEWDLKFEDRDSRKDPKLDRHREAKRDMKPAWMTKGVGCGNNMFGTPTGIIKPGDDQKVEAKPRDPNEPDPMGDVYHNVITTINPDGTKVSIPDVSEPRPPGEPLPPPAIPAATKSMMTPQTFAKSAPQKPPPRQEERKRSPRKRSPSARKKSVKKSKKRSRDRKKSRSRSRDRRREEKKSKKRSRERSRSRDRRR